MKKFLKNNKIILKIGIVIFIIIIIVVIPLLVNFIVLKENYIYEIAKDNDWIGFLGSYIGSIVGGILTLLGVILTIIHTNNLNRKQITLDNLNRELERLILLTHKIYEAFQVKDLCEYIRNVNSYKGLLDLNLKFAANNSKEFQFFNLDLITCFNKNYKENELKIVWSEVEEIINQRNLIIEEYIKISRENSQPVEKNQIKYKDYKNEFLEKLINFELDYDEKFFNLLKQLITIKKSEY